MVDGSPTPQSRTEAVQPSLWDRLVDDLPGIVAETDRQRADLVARSAQRASRRLVRRGRVIESDATLMPTPAAICTCS